MKTLVINIADIQEILMSKGIYSAICNFKMAECLAWLIVRPILRSRYSESEKNRQRTILWNCNNLNFARQKICCFSIEKVNISLLKSQLKFQILAILKFFLDVKKTQLQLYTIYICAPCIGDRREGDLSMLHIVSGSGYFSQH